MVRHNYLNNKDILKEIHKSKNTYCYYADTKYADYDMILPDVGKINKKNIKEGKQARADRDNIPHSERRCAQLFFVFPDGRFHG